MRPCVLHAAPRAVLSVEDVEAGKGMAAQAGGAAKEVDLQTAE